MTREEAKRLLEIEKECMNCDPSRLCYDSYLKPVCENYPFKESHSWEEAIYVAIKALSVETCEDAISRAAAIKAMDDLEQEDIELYGCSIPEGFDGKRAIEALQSLPSVTPNMSENPTGTNCTACILDGTDACSRGAGRAVDGRVCEDFVGESEE